MKSDWSHLEKFRFRDDLGHEFNTPTGAHYGYFLIPVHPTGSEQFAVLASDGRGEGDEKTDWEHVSFHVVVDAQMRTNRIPTWRECCAVKQMFWDDYEVVVQYHVDGPAKVNLHPCVLHLWRPVIGCLPMPDPKMV